MKLISTVNAKTGFRWLAPLSRLFISFIFLVSGFSKIPFWSATVTLMTLKGMPDSRLFLALAILIEITCAALILTGNRARFAAAFLFLYLIPVTLIFHDFWAFQGIERTMQLVNFLKNLAIMGGLLHVVSLGAGAYSIDSLRENYLPVEKKTESKHRLRRVS